jgi:hypothetical protein
MFCKKLFQTSCSEDFLVGWEKQYPLSAKAASEEEIFETAGLPFIIPALRENDSILGKAKEKKLKLLFSLRMCEPLFTVIATGVMG